MADFLTLLHATFERKVATACRSGKLKITFLNKIANEIHINPISGGMVHEKHLGLFLCHRQTPGAIEQKQSLCRQNICAQDVDFLSSQVRLSHQNRLRDLTNGNSERHATAAILNLQDVITAVHSV